MELSIKPIKGDCGIEAGSEIRLILWSRETADGVSVDWHLETAPEVYEVNETSTFANQTTALTVTAPESTEHPLQISVKTEDSEPVAASFPVVSASPTHFSVEHAPGFEIDGSPNCTRVAVKFRDQFRNPISDGVPVTVTLSSIGKLLEIDRANERTSSTLNGESVFYLDEEVLLPHNRYIPKVRVMVEGPQIKELNLRTWEFEDHQPSHVVIQ